MSRGRDYERLRESARAGFREATEADEEAPSEGSDCPRGAHEAQRRWRGLALGATALASLLVGALQWIGRLAPPAEWGGSSAAGPTARQDCGGAPCVVSEVEARSVLAAEDCHTAAEGEAGDEGCWIRVDWVMRTGISKHPDWYAGLSSNSTFEEVQQHVVDEADSPCPVPCAPGQAATKAKKKKKKKKQEKQKEKQKDEVADGTQQRETPKPSKDPRPEEQAEADGPAEQKDEHEHGQRQEESEDGEQVADPGSCSDGWKPPLECAPTFEYNGESYTGCTTVDNAEEQGWCSNEPVYKSLWSLCAPCDDGSSSAAAVPEDPTTTAAAKKAKATKCHTVKKHIDEDKECYDRVAWVQNRGIDDHPNYYAGLSPQSTFEDVQAFVNKEKTSACPAPCVAQAAGAEAAGSEKPSGGSTGAGGDGAASCPACAPKQPVVPDVVIPFFERDLCKLKYTAKSFRASDPDNNLGDVWLMWVSNESSSRYQDELDAITEAIGESHKVHFRDYTGALQSSGISGWFGQQVLKLKIAHDVKAEFYVVLDAKNTLIREVQPDSFFSRCNQARIQAEFKHDDIPQPHSDWYARSAKALALDPPSSGYWPASVTPVVMHTQTVLDLLLDLGEDPDPAVLCAGPLCDKIGAYSSSGHGATEFTMYTLWAYQKTQLECAHAVEQLPHFKLMYSSNWLDRLDERLTGINVTTPGARKQITVSSQDGWPLEWSPADSGEAPTEDKFPLKFEDLTRSWSASLWRGVPENAQLLEAVNLWTLRNLVDQQRQHPLMFGAQPEALSTMDAHTRKKAIRELSAVYAKAKLHDPSTEPDDELVSCVVGSKN